MASISIASSSACRSRYVRCLVISPIQVLQVVATGKFSLVLIVMHFATLLVLLFSILLAAIHVAPTLCITSRLGARAILHQSDFFYRSELMSGYMRKELAGRPLDGTFVLRMWEEPGVNLEAVQDVQLVLNYRYWTAFD